MRTLHLFILSLSLLFGLSFAAVTIAPASQAAQPVDVTAAVDANDLDAAADAAYSRGDMRLYMRVRAVALREHGLPAREIADALGVGRTSVYQWHTAWRAGGIEALQNHHTVGPRGHYQRSAQREQLVERMRSMVEAGSTWRAAAYAAGMRTPAAAWLAVHRARPDTPLRNAPGNGRKKAAERAKEEVAS
jgi:transposase